MSNNPTNQASSVQALARPAGFATRLAAFGIDLVTISFATSITVAIAQLVFGFFDINLPAVLQANPLVASLFAIGAALFQLLYFVLGWVILGQTPGKILMGLRVIGTHQQRLTPFQAIVRYFGYWLSAVVLFVGFLWALWDARRQTWHDKLARTLVVYTADVYAPSNVPGQVSRRGAGASSVGQGTGRS